VFNASWQRFRVHFMRNALAHAKSGRRVASVSAFIATTMPRLRERSGGRSPTSSAPPPKLASFLDVLAYMTFPPQHRTKLQSQPDQAADRGGRHLLE
jgi:hypothetical protein